MELDRASQHREKLVKAWRFFYKRGFLDGFGHISARLPSGQIVVSRHSLGPTVCYFIEKFIIHTLRTRHLKFFNMQIILKLR